MSTVLQLLSAVDEASWEALGSKGLLRRATKELERGVACEVVEDSPLLAIIRVGDCSVTVPREGPARAKCSCGAAACCHHLITAGLFCRRQSSPTKEADSATPSPAADTQEGSAAVLQAILALDFSLVKRWAGASAWRAALRALASGITVQTNKESAALVLRLDPLGVQCRFLPGAELDGTIVDGATAKSQKTQVATAVIGLKVLHGQVVPPEESAEAVLAEEKGAPRTRAEVLETTKEVLESVVAAGISHVGSASAERFATLAVSADGTNLPRLARMLKTVADDLNLIATQQAAADTERTLFTMAQAYALTAALRKAGAQASAQLIGEHRTGYVEIRSLSLQGVTVFPWRARSGFRGLTVLFWDKAAKRWNTWSDSRSTTSDPRFDPVRAIDGDAPWTAGVAIRQLAVSHVELTQARRNLAGRLSSTQACVAQVRGPAPTESIDFGPFQFSSWGALARYVGTTGAAGLRSTDPLADWVVLSPARWGEARYNRVEQRLLLPVFDAEGAELWLNLPYSELSQAGVEILERWQPPSQGGARVVARLLRQPGTLQAEPVCILLPPGSGGSAIHLLAPATSTKAQGASPAAPRAALDEGEELESEAGADTETILAEQWFIATRNLLVSCGEGGSQKIKSSREAAELASRQLAHAGLSVLAGAVSRVGSGERPSPDSVLIAAYLLRLHEQCRAS